MSPPAPDRPLRVRWLGRVAYADAAAVQHRLFDEDAADHLLLLEHPDVYTLGRRADPAHVLARGAGVDVVATDRGGDVTYHGPGQLVGYPIMTLPEHRGGLADSRRYVRTLEQVLIDAVGELGVAASRLDGFPGIWVGADGPSPRKLAAIGVRLRHARTMHGFALNVTTDLDRFAGIVPCGLADKGVTSLAAEGVDATMREVADLVVGRFVARFGIPAWDRHDVAWRVRSTDLALFSRDRRAASTPTRPTRGTEAPTGRMQRRLEEAGTVTAVALRERKPPWLKVQVNLTERYQDMKAMMHELDLVTVCEDAGCPNIFECWGQDGTATFMINGSRCTRACGFCLVDTRQPLPPDPDEPRRVAEAVARMGLRFAVVTTVARDDLADGGASGFAAVIAAIRERSPGTAVEVLISDCKGDEASLDIVYDARPDVLNHNLETVPRLQRAVRPSASYARSLAVLARARGRGLTTKTGLVAGMGETREELEATLVDARAIGVDIVTIGQYLRPSARHLPVARWVHPDEFAALKRFGEDLGIGHVEAGPLTRSSYHAGEAAASTTGRVDRARA